MRIAHIACIAAAVIAVGAAPAKAQTIVVTPNAPRPGQKVHISVPDCSVGPTAHTATSAAFTRTVTLFGKSDTGDADPTIRADLKPGTYPIVARCGGTHIVRGQVVVPGPSLPSASPIASGGRDQGASAPYWVLGALVVALATGAGVFLLRRRTRER